MPTSEEILIREVAGILAIEPASVSAEMTLQELGFDSLKLVELLVVIEKEFNINLMETGITQEDFRNIRSLAARINEHQQI
jgi:acyl carrier protein